MSLDFPLPVGTQAVIQVARADDVGELRPAGSVGVVREAPSDPTHSYEIELPDGRRVRAKRRELSVLSEHQGAGLALPDELDLRRHVIYRCVVGSRAHGLDHEGSDRDVRGVYLPPASRHWSLSGVPEQLEDQEKDECFWEIQKFLVLALKSNPNILECLATPLVEHATPLADELRALRTKLYSRLAYQTYNGYVLSQFKKLEGDLRNHGAPRWKHAMHLIRLLHSGIELLATGELLVDVGEHRDELLSIKAGEWSWERLQERRLALHERFEEAHRTTVLRARPDYDAANAFLLRARRDALEIE